MGFWTSFFWWYSLWGVIKWASWNDSCFFRRMIFVLIVTISTPQIIRFWWSQEILLPKKRNNLRSHFSRLMTGKISFLWCGSRKDSRKSCECSWEKDRTSSSRDGISRSSFGHPQEYARLLSVILGGNMSSRMFLSVREEKGLSVIPFILLPISIPIPEFFLLMQELIFAVFQKRLLPFQKNIDVLLKGDWRSRTRKSKKSFLKENSHFEWKIVKNEQVFWSTSNFAGEVFLWKNCFKKSNRFLGKMFKDIARTFDSRTMSSFAHWTLFWSWARIFKYHFSTMKQYLISAKKNTEEGLDKEDRTGTLELVPFWAQCAFLSVDGFLFSHKKCIFEVLSTNYSGFFLETPISVRSFCKTLNIWNE